MPGVGSRTWRADSEETSRPAPTQRELWGGGLLLPCNVIVYELAPNRSVVSAMAPLAAMSIVADNPKLKDVAREADARLRSALTTLEKAGK